MSKRIYSCCIFAVLLLTATLRWLKDATAPWSEVDESFLVSGLCCTAIGLSLLCIVVFCIVKLIGTWGVLSSECLGLVVLAVFVYVSLPLVGALLTPKRPNWPLDRDCEYLKQFALEGGLDSYQSEIWLDIDGDDDLERWEQISSRTGANEWNGAVFVYEKGTSKPRWCGQVTTDSGILPAWIRPINLDLDLAPEMWMRSTGLYVTGSMLPETVGFVDFSPSHVEEFDPRLMILLVLLPFRVLLLLAWLPFRHKPIPRVAIAVMVIFAYVFTS